MSRVSSIRQSPHAAQTRDRPDAAPLFAAFASSAAVRARGILMAARTSTAARTAPTANTVHTPANPIASNTVGVTTAAAVEPTQPQTPQMPMAVPTLPGSTHALTTKGPHVVRMVRATPSTAREATSAALEPAASPIHDPVTAMPNAATIMFFAPNRCASNPDGNAANTLASVKIDMSQEAASASMSKSAMRELRMVGTLYWIMATATPAASSTVPTRTGLR